MNFFKKTKVKASLLTLLFLLIVSIASWASAAHLYEGTGAASVKSATVFGGILVAILVIMALEIVDKSIVTLLGAIFCLALAYSPPFELLTHEPSGHGVAPFYIAAIDWSTIFVIVGTSIFVELASRSGIFSWSAIKLTKASGGDPFKLLAFYSVLTVLFSAFLNNVTAMIIVGSLTVISCSRLKLPLFPFLFTEGLLTNVGGLLTLVSSIPNILIGNSAGISFGRFFLIAAPYTIAATVVTIALAKYFFSEIKSLKDPDEIAQSQAIVDDFDETETVSDPRFFWVSWVAMALVVFGFAFQSQIPILKYMGLEAVAMSAAGIFLLLYAAHRVEEVLNTVEWSLIMFFCSLFVILGVMEQAGVLRVLGLWLLKVLSMRPGFAASSLLWLSAGLSSVTDNIPLAAILAQIFGDLNLASNSYAWWSAIFGCNLGGNLTPIGSASTVVALTIMKRQKLDVTFFQFIKTALPFALTHLALGSLYILILYWIGILI